MSVKQYDDQLTYFDPITEDSLIFSCYQRKVRLALRHL